MRLVLRLPLVVLRRLALGLHLRQLGFLPAAAAFGEDALEEDRGGLVAAALGAGQLGLGRHQPPFDGGLEHRGAIALQVALHPLQRRHGVVEPGEVGLDGFDDAVLLGLAAGECEVVEQEAQGSCPRQRLLFRYSARKHLDRSND
jgi:hypothetical protein